MIALQQGSNQEGTFDALQGQSLFCESSERKDKKRKKLKKRHKKLKKAYKRQSAELQKLKEQENTKVLFLKTLSNAMPKLLQFFGDVYKAHHSEKMLDKQLSFEMYNKKHKKKHKKNKSNLVT